MRRGRYIQPSKIFSGFALFILSYGMLELVSYSTKTTAARLWELWDKNRVLNGKEVRHQRNYDVILSAYMNSGSTYTGRLLGFRDDAFYFYEPLWHFTLWGYIKSNFTICSTRILFCWELLRSEKNKPQPYFLRLKMEKDYERFYDVDIGNGTMTLQDISKTVLREIFQCRLLQVKGIVRAAIYENAKLTGPSWDTFRNCRFHRGTFENCLSLLQRVNCKKAKHKVSKVLRLTVDAFEDLLKELPNLKVVHLFRDPRAIIHSRIETLGYPIEKDDQNIQNNAKALCNKMSLDLEAGIKLKKRFPNRFRFIQYEDIYTRNISLIKLHTYLGIVATKGSLDFGRLPLSTHRGFQSISSRKERNGNNAFWWRKFLSWQNMRKVDAECSFLYEKLGYPYISDRDDMKNYNISLLLHNLAFSFA